MGELDDKIASSNLDFQLDYPEEKIARIIESLELHHIDGEDYSKKGKGAVVWRSTFDKFLTIRQMY